jgi:hypothetical protein
MRAIRRLTFVFAERPVGGSVDGRIIQKPAAQVMQRWPVATGRQHSATNGCFRELKKQRPLFGDELEEMSFASRP